MDTGPVCRKVCLFTPQIYAGAKLYCLVTEATVCMNNLSKDALDSAAAGIEPAISNLKSRALTKMATITGSGNNLAIFSEYCRRCKSNTCLGLYTPQPQRNGAKTIVYNNL